MISFYLHNFHVTDDFRGVVTVAWDLPNRSVNVLNQTVFAELQTLLEELERDPAVRLVLFTSGKESAFLAGADLREIDAIPSREAAAAFSALGQEVFRRVERLAVPTVAAMAGPCLGGGLEFALACRYRLARDDARTRLGFPEVALGLSPAWGGTQRLLRLVGLRAALPMLLEGRTILARPAEAMGLVDGTWSAGQWAGGVQQFIADRLGSGFQTPIAPVGQERPTAVGQEYPTYSGRRMGILARCLAPFLKRSLGRRLLLARARRQVLLRRGPDSAAAAILASVEQGVVRGQEAGLAREREALADLLFTPLCRTRLQQFFQRHKSRELTKSLGT
jgi:3-hydroxyacyl-CoA dehydrogenase/enoyl-CoA hydratase/3-hydroxybutyryl-CoA epimerase